MRSITIDRVATPSRTPRRRPVPGDISASPETRQPSDASSSPLVLLVASRDRRGYDRLAGAATQAAVLLERQDLRTVLVDLDPTCNALSNALGGEDAEGIVDVLEFGVTLYRAVQEVPGASFGYLPTGPVALDVDRLLVHSGWPGVLAEARRRNLTLLALVPPEQAALDALRKHSDRVVLIADPDEEQALRELLAGDVAVRAVVSAPALRKQVFVPKLVSAETLPAVDAALPVGAEEWSYRFEDVPEDGQGDPRTAAPVRQVLRFVFRTLLVGGGWLLFLFWWSVVLSDVTPFTLFVILVEIAIGVALIGTTAHWWIRHNLRIARNGKRGRSSRYLVPDLQRDLLGRRIDRSGMDPAGTSLLILVDVTADTKRFLDPSYTAAA